MTDAKGPNVMSVEVLIVSEILVKLGRTVRASVVRFWTGLISDRPDHYHPERHYMRGPGPKWRQKHRTR